MIIDKLVKEILEAAANIESNGSALAIDAVAAEKYRADAGAFETSYLTLERACGSLEEIAWQIYTRVQIARRMVPCPKCNGPSEQIGRFWTRWKSVQVFACASCDGQDERLSSVFSVVADDPAPNEDNPF